jgi:hypothetical protein
VIRKATHFYFSVTVISEAEIILCLLYSHFEFKKRLYNFVVYDVHFVSLANYISVPAETLQKFITLLHNTYFYYSEMEKS